MNYGTEGWYKLYVRESTEDRLLPVFNRALRDFLLRLAKSREDATILRSTKNPGADLARALNATADETALVEAYVQSMLDDGYLSHDGARLWITNFVDAQRLKSPGAMRQDKWRKGQRDASETEPRDAPPVTPETQARRTVTHARRTRDVTSDPIRSDPIRSDPIRTDPRSEPERARPRESRPRQPRVSPRNTQTQIRTESQSGGGDFQSERADTEPDEPARPPSSPAQTFSGAALRQPTPQTQTGSYRKPGAKPEPTPNPPPSTGRDPPTTSPVTAPDTEPTEADDPGRETVCPTDLVERLKRAGTDRALAEKLAVPLESVIHELRQFEAYWVIGKGQGQRRTGWPGKARQWVVEQHARPGGLKPIGAIAHEERKRRDGEAYVPSEFVQSVMGNLLRTNLK